jgi:PDZ domain
MRSLLGLPTHYNLGMRFSAALIVTSLLAVSAVAQTASKVEPEPKSVTVPITLDHNRVVIDVYLPLPDGSTKRVRGWVDNGNPDLCMSRRAATLMGLNVTCNDKECSATPPAAVMVGEMKIPLSGIKEAKIPLKPPDAAAVMEPGMSAEISIPSTVLRNYDVLINYPDREFSIGLPGSLQLKGVKSKMLVNANGLIQIPSKIENRNYSLGLDLGSSISFLAEDLFDKLAAAHADWPHMTGAVGPANLWGRSDETKWRVIRIDRLQYGPLYLTSVAVVASEKYAVGSPVKHAAPADVGIIGANALMSYRIGLDYAHATAYFDLGSTFKFPDFDVVGLILRPEDDTRFTVLGVADFDGKPSVPEGDDGVQAGDHLVAVDGIPVPDSTMGQVWSLLEGTPGQERKLTVERGGKQFTVAANVQHFLGEAEENQSKEKAAKKK